VRGALGLYAIKPWFVARLGRVEDALVRRRVRPNVITATAIIVSIAAGAAIALGGMLEQPLWWLAVPPLVLARLALNALDGSVARRTGRARPFGAALNELGDRACDAALLGATATVAGPALALGAVAASQVVSITGVTAQAITGRRDTSGPMGKADRAAVVAAGAVGGALLGSTRPFVIALWVVIGGALITAALRMLRLRRALARPQVASLLAQGEVAIPDVPVVEEEMLYAIGR